MSEILVQKKQTDSDTQWALPGGRLKIGETVVAGISREIAEEFGVSTFNHRFLGIIEQSLIIGGQKIHEHSHIYSAEFLGNIACVDTTLDWKWLPLEEADTIKPAHCGRLMNASSCVISNGFVAD